MYKVIWKDYQGNAHEKSYSYLGSAMKKVFAVYGWFKNGNLFKGDKKII